MGLWLLNNVFYLKVEGILNVKEEKNKIIVIINIICI